MQKPTSVRGIVLSMIVMTAAGAGCTSDELIGPPPDEPELALAWDLEQDPASNAAVCPAEAPDCDRLDEPDAVDEAGDPIVADALFDALADGDEAATGAPRGLADPTLSGKYRVWPNGRIPYKLALTSTGSYQLGSTTRTRLSQAMTNWELLTEGRVKFRKKTASDTAYVLIKAGSPRVSPFVGYRPGKVQQLYLRNPEYLTVIKHELGHVVGLHHEQRRTDRSTYIKVRSANIVDTTTCQYQFSTCSTCARVGTYDRLSVMHYRTTDLANCRTGPVLLKLDGTAIDHVWKLSARDLTSVAKMYATALPPPPTGTTTPWPHPEALDLFPTGTLMAASGACAGIADGSSDEGAGVIGGGCAGGDDQDWRTTRSGQLRAKHSLRCAAVAGPSQPGTAVEQAVCTPDDARQQWAFPQMELVHGATSKCVTRAAPGLQLAACSERADQRFDYVPEREAIAVDGACLTAGATVALRPCDGTPAQRWLQARGGFVNRSDTGSCLALAPDGATLELAACSDAADQRWAVRGAIRDARAALCLQGAPGKPLALATCDGAPAQAWTFWSR